MTKKQKIWLWVGAAMFAVPEVLWSPVGNFVYSLIMPSIAGSVQIFRRNQLILNASNHPNPLTSLLFLQFLGLTLAVTIVTIKAKSTTSKLCMAIIGYSLSLLVLLLFGLSISLRSIGF